MTNGDWIRTLDDAKANELFGGWIPCEDWGGEPGELIRDNDEELAYVISVGSAFDRKMVCSHCKIHEEGFTCTDNDCMNGVKRWLSEDDYL